MAPRKTKDAVKEKPAPKPRKKLKQFADGTAVVRLSKRTAELVNNPGSIKDWDDEELLRGQRKDKNGRFSGQPPRYIPQEVSNELAKRKIAFAQQTLVHSLTDAIDTLVEVAKDKNVDPHARIKAAGMIADRVLGKPKENIRIEGETPKWLEALQVSIVSNVQQADIIDAEVVEG